MLGLSDVVSQDPVDLRSNYIEQPPPFLLFIQHSTACPRSLTTDPFYSAMGKSRSVTMVIAYLLRQYPHHTVSSALSLVQESRPIAEPNEGFMSQLHLYKDMGCPRNIDAQPRYQRWLYQREVDLALAAGMAPDKVRFEDEEKQEERSGEEREVELRCRKCRYVALPNFPFRIRAITDMCFRTDHPAYNLTNSSPNIKFEI